MSITDIGNTLLRFVKSSLTNLLVFVILLISTEAKHAQGAIILFGDPAVGSGTATSKTYTESGVRFQVVAPPGKLLYHDIGRVGSLITHSVPTNGTPHGEFKGSAYYANYVVISMVDSNTFGLASVDLADSYAPSSIAQTIEFNGYKMDGSIVTNSFTTAGGGISRFEEFNFTAEFSSDLTKVEIPSYIWAMDNLVIVPEPSTITFFIVGLGAYTGWFWKKRRV